MSTKKKFSERFTCLRNSMNAKQAEFAEALGVSRNYVSMIEGGREPSDSLIKLFEIIERDFLNRPGLGRRALKPARLRKGLSIAAVAEAAGYSVPVYREIEEGRSQMGEKMAERVASILDLSLETLLDGSDHPPERGVFQGTFGAKPSVEMGPGMDGQKAKYIPLLSMAQCGAGMVWDDGGYTGEGFLVYSPKDPKAFAVRLSGDSMMDKYEPGDVATVYPSFPPANGGLVIARLTDDAGGDVMFKRYHAARDQITLTSYNPMYPDLNFSRSDFTWIYPVAGVSRVFM